MGDFNAEPAEPTVRTDAGAGFRSAYAEANGAEPAVTWPSGLQAPAMDTDGDPAASTTSGSAARSGSIERGSRSTGPPSDDPTLYPSDHLGLSAAPRDRLTRGGDGRPRGRSGSPTAATGGTPRRTRSRRSLAALAIPGCDGLEFDVRAVARRRAGAAPRRDADARPGPPERVDELTADGARGSSASRRSRDVLAAVPRRAFLDVELKGDARPGASSRCSRPGAAPALRNAVVSSFEPATLERVARPAPRLWPRWLNADDLEPATIATALELGCRGISVEWRAIDGGRMALARAAGLEVAAWTVRRRATFDRLARLGVAAICVGGRRARRLTRRRAARRDARLTRGTRARSAR